MERTTIVLEEITKRMTITTERIGPKPVPRIEEKPVEIQAEVLQRRVARVLTFAAAATAALTLAA